MTNDTKTTPSSDEIHAWIDRAYRRPDDPARLDAPRFTRWNMEVAYAAGYREAMERRRPWWRFWR